MSLNKVKKIYNLPNANNVIVPFRPIEKIIEIMLDEAIDMLSYINPEDLV